MASAHRRDQPKQRDVTIGVRFSTEDATILRRMAKDRGMTASALLRAALEAYTEPAPALTSRVITQDYSARARPAPERAQVHFEPGFNFGPPPVSVSLATLGG